MSAVTAPFRSVPEWAARLKVTQWRVIVSEWTKFRSLRSTLWTLGVGVVLGIGFSLIAATVTGARWASMSLADRAGRHPLDIALVGVRFSQLAFGVLGVLVISGEYSTGMIRASIGAVPKRLPVLWGKIAVFGFVTLVLAIPIVLAGFFGSQAILEHAYHIPYLKLSFGAHGVARAVIGGALYLTVMGIFALGLGAITRNTAGGLTLFAAIIFVIPPLLFILPTSWNDAISKYLPSNAGAEIFQMNHGSNDLHPWPGFLLFCGYTAIVIAIAAVLLVRRDT
jgi:ABC-type transport system involved in multi-copper enzyme maturation permease subunit